jgi:hypothetical protein
MPLTHATRHALVLSCRQEGASQAASAAAAQIASAAAAQVAATTTTITSPPTSTPIFCTATPLATPFFPLLSLCTSAHLTHRR